MTTKKPRFIVESPDGLPIRPRPFASYAAARTGLDVWCRRFAHQGFYAAVGGRIALAALPTRCTIRAVSK